MDLIKIFVQGVVLINIVGRRKNDN